MRPTRFDLLAPLYETLERVTFGNWLQQCRVAHLHLLTDARKVLILGEGDGRFLAAFLAENAHAHVDVVDASKGMVQLARQRVAAIPGTGDRVYWQVRDARIFLPDDSNYDLIVTNFFLDCFPIGTLDLLIDRLLRELAPDGLWLVGDFAMPERQVERQLAQIALLGMYGFFRIVTSIPAGRLVDPHPVLENQGLQILSRWKALGGFLTSTLWQKTHSRRSEIT